MRIPKTCLSEHIFKIIRSISYGKILSRRKKLLIIQLVDLFINNPIIISKRSYFLKKNPCYLEAGKNTKKSDRRIHNKILIYKIQCRIHIIKRTTK